MSNVSLHSQPQRASPEQTERQSGRGDLVTFSFPGDYLRVVANRHLVIPQGNISKKTTPDLALQGAVVGASERGFLVHMCVQENKHRDIEHALGQMVINAMGAALHNKQYVSTHAQRRTVVHTDANNAPGPVALTH